MWCQGARACVVVGGDGGDDAVIVGGGDWMHGVKANKIW